MKNLKTAFVYFMALTFLGMTVLSSCKKKDDDDNDPDTTKKYALVIENGAQTINPEQTITYSAKLVDVNGNVTTPSGVTWTTSSTEVCTISGAGVVGVVASGTVTITASVSVDGVTYTASVPLGIMMPSVFAVAPSAIIYEVGGSIQLETVYFSPTATVPSCTFTSSNTAVATVSSGGLVTFTGVGSCGITVTATNLDGSPSVIVPVLVVGVPEITLPIVRIEVDPPSKDLFKNETQTLTATAYNGEDAVVSTTFTWKSLDPNIATVNASGLVTPLKTGKTYIQAFSDGIIGQAEIIVNPDTLVVVDPIYFSIPQGGTKQFTATAYHITRTTCTPMTGITFDWMIPTYGISVFDIATVNATGLVTLKTDAMPGMTTFVMAYDHNNMYVGAAAIIMVGIASDCDCGAGNAAVSSIVISNSDPLNISLMSGVPTQLNATAYNSTGGVVSAPALAYCSDNETVATVNESGEIMAVGMGTATITVCSGTYASETITVNVNL
ncbi:MAG: hypothetical protein A2W91_17770 [Bacteroidetes bacterium GWF2_38_335]|nr:MAG: hypothetical protein A2W91_17770 [Bacteroidetes bacterium GWF2_38_335]OFY78017.1 MAG: hypothetical protein A2281_18690 [Bacteroidetes bacterium RIFOXYA12_FULL_38_20]HBS88289.1 hypothetical protein [Bacteroidales bacterium]